VEDTAPKIFAAPIGVVLLPGWVPTNVFFSSGAAFLSLAPSSAKGYYATDFRGHDAARDAALHAPSLKFVGLPIRQI